MPRWLFASGQRTARRRQTGEIGRTARLTHRTNKCIQRRGASCASQRRSLRIDHSTDNAPVSRRAKCPFCIAVPVAMLTLAAVNADSFQLTPQERADRVMGAADAAIDVAV